MPLSALLRQSDFLAFGGIPDPGLGQTPRKGSLSQHLVERGLRTGATQFSRALARLQGCRELLLDPRASPGISDLCV